LYPALEKHGHTKTYRTAVEAVMSDPGVDAVYTHLFTPLAGVACFDFDHMAEMSRKHRKPLVVWLQGDASRMPEIARELESRGIPVSDEMSRSARILAALAAGR
ncbi:MAG: hypothetical protein AB1640_11650, partial [bacterium]